MEAEKLKSTVGTQSAPHREQWEAPQALMDSGLGTNHGLMAGERACKPHEGPDSPGPAKRGLHKCLLNKQKPPVRSHVPRNTVFPSIGRGNNVAIRYLRRFTG